MLSYFDNFLSPLRNIRTNKLAFSLSVTETYGSRNIKNGITRDWNENATKLDIDPLENSKAATKSHLKSYLLDSLAHHIKADRK